MALVAQHGGMTLGVARYSAYPDRLSAEFAVAVRSDWHGRGAPWPNPASSGQSLGRVTAVEEQIADRR